MATRKSGMDESGGDRPGSYAKTSGSRRKRKGKKGRSTNPPAPGQSSPDELLSESAEQPIDDALDTEGEEVESSFGRATRPDWGVTESDNSVDDLRRKPTSSRAPRTKLGPLGMEEPLEGASSSAPPHLSTPRPSPRPSPHPRMNVVEIGPNDGSDNDNLRHDSLEPSPNPNPFGDPFEHESMGSEPPQRERGDERREERGPARSGRPSRAPQHDSLAVDAAYRNIQARGTYDEEDDGPIRPSLSSVFDARPSLRPSPPPPRQTTSSTSILWWVVVSLLSAIIVAAGLIAYKESQQTDEAGRAAAPLQAAPQALEPPAGEPAQGAAPARGATQAAVSAPIVTPVVTPVPTVSPLGTPAAAPKSAPTSAPASASAAAKAPATTAQPSAAKPVATAAPVAARLPAANAAPAVAPTKPPAAPRPVAAPAASASDTASAPDSASSAGVEPEKTVVTPAEWAADPLAPAPHAPRVISKPVKPQAPAVLHPRTGKAAQTNGIVKEPIITPPPPPVPEPESSDERLPQNPYR